MIVVDTNILAYFLIGGEQVATVEQLLRRDAHWAAPRLWRSELRNALATSMRTTSMALEAAKEIMIAAEDRMRDREYDVPSGDVLEYAERSGLSAYDCEFVVLASKLAVPLVTADRRITRMFPEIARLLSEYVA